jgi:hypothetical protein
MEIIDELERTRVETLGYFGLGDSELASRYAPEKWSVRWILHHLCDAETVLYDRIRRAISEPRQVIWAFDQDAWAQGLEYERRPLEISRDIYLAVRAGVIDAARRHYERDGHREFVHSETGVRTLREELDKVAWHNEHHLQQIRQALGRPGPDREST